MALANVGAYQKFFKEDILPDVRYDLAEELYGFIRSAENSPLSIGKEINGEFKELYKVPNFTREQSNYLLRPRKRRKQPEEPEQLLGLIQKIGKRRTIIDVYENKDTVLSIAPEEIVAEDKIYRLHTPLLCAVTKEDGNFIVEHKMLDLYAAGATIDEAEIDFYNEFHQSYQLFQSLPDNELSERLLRAKVLMSTYIKEISLE